MKTMGTNTITTTNNSVNCAVTELAAPVKLPFFSAPPTAVATGPINCTPMSVVIIASIAAIRTSTAMLTYTAAPEALEKLLSGSLISG